MSKNFEIINGKLVPTPINEAVVIKAATAGVQPAGKDGEEQMSEADVKRLKSKLLQVVKHLNTGKLTIEGDALSKVFDTLNKHQKFDAFYDDEKFEETHQLKDEIGNSLDNLSTAQLKHVRDYVKGLK